MSRGSKGTAIAVLCGLLAVTGVHAEKEVFGWNQTAQTNTAYVSDPYWPILEYYSPYWFQIADQGDTLFDLSPRFSLISMRAFADAAQEQWPTKKVVPMVQLKNSSTAGTWVDSLLIRPTQRTRIIDQIQAVVDTLHFDGINIDFEYPSAAMRDSFSAFMAELVDSLGAERHVSCAVAAVGHSYSDGFDYGVLSDGAHGDLLLEMVYDRFPIESQDPDEHQSGPTTPLWWWEDNADLTHTNYPTGLSRFAMAGPTPSVLTTM